jgi:hypothetical protein
MNLLQFLIETNDPFAELPDDTPNKTEKIITRIKDERQTLAHAEQHMRERLVKRYPNQLAMSWTTLTPPLVKLPLSQYMSYVCARGNQPDPTIVRACKAYARVSTQLAELSKRLSELKKKRKQEIIDKKVTSAQTRASTAVPQQPVDSTMTKALTIFNGRIKAQNISNPYWGGSIGQYHGSVNTRLMSTEAKAGIDRLNRLLVAEGMPTLTQQYSSFKDTGEYVFAVRNTTKNALILRDKHGGTIVTYVYIGSQLMTLKTFMWRDAAVIQSYLRHAR